MMDPKLAPGAVFAIAAFLALPAAAQEKTLSWREITVAAQLDARGTLHVRERQTFVFNGDWNGGERSFRIGFNNHLELDHLFRIALDGREIPLVKGDIDQVDHYEWADSDTLRWRSRLPGDPPFQETVIPYVLDYTISGILTKQGDTYRIDHDFSLPDVAWPIERLTVDLRLDPAWQPIDPVPAHFEQANLQPGSHLLVTARLRHVGETPAEPGASIMPVALRRGLFAASLLAMIFLYVHFRRAEAARGRFEPIPIPKQWDDEWLRENVFDLLPEEAGALWDQKIGPPEVAAVLARMVAEGKMTSEVRKSFTLFGKSFGPGVLHLRLQVDRATLIGYERKLVTKLFFAGDDTDTDRVRQHYKRTGFDPAATIEAELRGSLGEHARIGAIPAPGKKRTLWLAAAAVALFAIDAIVAIAHSLSTLVLFAIAVFGLFWLTLAGILAATAWRKRTERLDLASLTFLVPGLLAWGFCLVLAFLDVLFGPRAGLFPGLAGALALAVAPVAVWSSILNQARSREDDTTLRKRRLLVAARHLLRRELESEHPRLQDDWLPYLLAFGLGTDVDRWFRSFGGRLSAASAFATSSGGGSYGGGSSGGGWTGGGGQFGGAGATGSWAVAAAGLASGVSAPSSSGGGGGGGGGSSGGGGGGGW